MQRRPFLPAVQANFTDRREYILYIADIKLKSNLILAPMAGITDKVFRSICAHFGAGMVFTEMVSANGLAHSNAATRFLLSQDNSGVPCAAQLFGHEPELLAAAAASSALSSFPIIDINMGCPAKKIVSNGDGSALMRSPKLIFKIVSAVKDAADRPVTVKIRMGFDSPNAVECALAAQEGGASAITVHGRTREQGYSGKCNLEIIRKVCAAVKVPVIGNGDVSSGRDAQNMLSAGCSGVMIGRAAFGRPWIFAEISSYFDKSGFAISNKEKHELISAHFKALCNFKGEYTAVREMRKHLAAYISGLRGAASLRNRIVTQSEPSEMLALIDEIFL